MALDPIALAALGNSIKAAFDAGFSENDPAKRDDAMQGVADDIAASIEAYVLEAIATVTLPAGTVIVAVSGGSGAPAVGVPNPADIPLIGDPDAGTGGLS